MPPAQSLLVINSHLTFPHAEIYKDMRLDQIKLVLEQARDYIQRERLDNVPVVRARVRDFVPLAPTLTS